MRWTGASADQSPRNPGEDIFRWGGGSNSSGNPSYAKARQKISAQPLSPVNVPDVLCVMRTLKVVILFCSLGAEV